MRISFRDIGWSLRSMFMRLTGRKSLEQERQERMRALGDLLSVRQVEVVEPANTREYFSHLAQNFTINSIVVAKADGSVLGASSDGSFSNAVKGSSLFEYVKSELPGAKYLLIKSNEKVHVIYPDKGLLYIAQATGDISPIEMKALARQAAKGVAA